MNSSQKSAIVLVIDRLQAAMVGPYGNTWIRTPEFNRLAAESFLFDQALCDSPHLGSLYRSYWQGRHAMLPDAVYELAAAVSSSGSAIPDQLREHGVSTTLLTDDPAVSRHPLASGFVENVTLELPHSAEAAEDVDDTGVARFFAEASAALKRATIGQQAQKRPFLLWLHTRALAGPWDAPLELRRQYDDEEDPEPPSSAEVPCRLLPADAEADPDELWGLMRVYAGQVSLLDACLGAFLEQFRQNDVAGRTLLVVVGTRGIFLGEHRRIGVPDEAIYSSLVHVPWLMRLPGGEGAADRSQSLIQPPDLAATLAEWFEVAAANTEQAQIDQSRMTIRDAVSGRSLLPIIGSRSLHRRDCVYVTSESGDRAIRTPGWYLRQNVHQRVPFKETVTGSNTELFVKPDDRFDMNEVSSHMPNVVEGLQAALRQFEDACAAGASGPVESLDDTLIYGPM